MSTLVPGEEVAVGMRREVMVCFSHPDSRVRRPRETQRDPNYSFSFSETTHSGMRANRVKPLLLVRVFTPTHGLTCSRLVYHCLPNSC